MKPIQAFIIELIEVGRSDCPSVPPSLANSSYASEKVRQGDRFWLEAAESLGADELRDLIKGLVFYDQASSKSFFINSVSPVISLYKKFCDRHPELEPPLTSWIMRNRRNLYEPFGTIMDEGAESLSEFRNRRERRLKESSNRQQQSMIARRAREQADATIKLPNAVRRGDVKAVAALIEKGGDLTQRDSEGRSLLQLALAHGRTSVAQLLRQHGCTEPDYPS